MAAHASLKNEFTEDEKYHNPMRWLKCLKKSKKEVLRKQRELTKFENNRLMRLGLIECVYKRYWWYTTE